MTAKRFKFNGRNNCIEYDGKSILLDSYGEDIEKLLNELHEENEMRKEHQRTLEDKIRRLKDRVKTFEKHYSLNDIERLRGD